MIVAAALALAAHPAAASAQPIDADRPGVLFAASVLAPRAVQLELGGFELARRTRGGVRTTRLNFPSVVRLGLGHECELQVSHTLVNLKAVDTGHPRREVGLGDLGLGLKVARGGSGPRPSLAVVGTVDLPTGHRPFSNGDVRLGVQGQALWAMGRGLSVGVLGGYARSARDGIDDETATLAASVSVSLARGWASYGEAAVLPAFRRAPTTAFVGGGATRAVGERVQVDVYVRRGVTTASVDWTVGGGVAVRL